MKRASVIALLFCIASGVIIAQTNKEEVEFVQSLFGMEKKAIVAGFVELDGDAGVAFWALYDQYETSRKALGQKRIELLNNYVQNYNQIENYISSAIRLSIYESIPFIRELDD